jgi:hypothetical protein
MPTIGDVISNMTTPNILLHVFVTIFAAIVAFASFGLLIPLDSVPAVTGVSIILGAAYAMSITMWFFVVFYYAKNPDNQNLVWLNTNLMFWVILPATIGATAMNVTAIQNTRNLLAGQVAA